MNKLKIATFFSGCGGLDLGFEKEGFDVVWANEYDKTIWDTYELNHPHAHLDRRSITEIEPSDIPDVDGFIGGPPCQSWSLAGAMRGINDHRGQLFYEYLRLIKVKKPRFILAENVKGMLSSTHRGEFERIKQAFADAGYEVSAKLLNAKNYGVAQDRQRVIVIGIRSDLHNKPFVFPEPTHADPKDIEGSLKFETKKRLPYQTLRDAIGDLPKSTPAKDKNKPNENLAIPNHEHMTGGFSTIYMSRNRKRSWDEVSFTIQAGGRHAPLHPSCPPMVKTGVDKQEFTAPDEAYRRMSVRECARVQGFSDDFVYKYKVVADGYKMVGNAVPVQLARACASSLKKYFKD